MSKLCSQLRAEAVFPDFDPIFTLILLAFQFAPVSHLHYSIRISVIVFADTDVRSSTAAASSYTIP